MYQGELVTQYVEHDMAQLDTWAWYSLNEQVARFERSDGPVGYGMHEYGVFGAFPKFGLADGAAVAALEACRGPRRAAPRTLVACGGGSGSGRWRSRSSSR